VGSYMGPGGLIDIMYSAFFTRGPEQVKKDALGSGCELPLISCAFESWLGNTELISLLLRGKADGNVGAFNAMGGQNAWGKSLGIGMLSKIETEVNIPLCDALKNPEYPIWILHGGDHFTTAWSGKMPPREKGASFELWHWNGLPPGGPRLANLRIIAEGGTSDKAPEKHKPTYYKPIPGQLEEVVQADPGDRKERPDQYRTWTYECVIAFDDPKVEGAPRPDDLPPPKLFNQKDPKYQRDGPQWRCTRCFATRFKTMNFGVVKGSPDKCTSCGRSKEEAGWSLWIPFDDLPDGRKRQVMGRHAKKIETVLWTKWPAAKVTTSDDKLPSC